MVSKPPIYFHYLTDAFYFPRRTQTKQYLSSIFNKYSKKLEAVNYIFCTDQYLLSLNKDYLKHDYYTDIITFELNQPGAPVLSDVFISLDRAKDNAKRFSVSTHNEILRLLIHGSLHLCGFQDKKASDAGKMKVLENYYLAGFVPREIK